MSKFDAEFKVEAVKRALTSGLPVARVAVELGVFFASEKSPLLQIFFLTLGWGILMPIIADHLSRSC